MIRKAREGEEAALEAFLSGYPETSMFLRSNLAEHGVGGGEHPHATDYWISETNSGISGVFARARNGFLMAQAPVASAAEWQAYASALQGQEVAGMTGEAGQVSAALAALGVCDHMHMNAVEPLYRIHLDHLPQVAVEMRGPAPEDEDLLRSWWEGYLLDTGAAQDAEAARRDAQMRIEAFQSGVQILIEEGQPVAMAAINARVANMVQVGGVYVPPEKRNAGRARAVTAGLLARARVKGAEVAVLFSNNDAASRAYEAIGFRRKGSYRVAILDRPRVIGA